MKNLIVLIVAVLLGTVVEMNAQTMSEGVIKMEISEVSSENPQIAAQLEMLKGTTTEYHFNKDKSIVKANMMGGMMKMTNLVNNSDEHLTLLMEMMGQKIMIESTKAERDKFEAEQGGEMDDIEVTYDENDTKVIQGYKCTKASVDNPNSEAEINMYMYVCPDVKASNKLVQGLNKVELRGFPLEVIIDSADMSMTVTTTELSDEVDNSVFEVNTAGYQKMTFEEFQSSMGAMGGGMGF